MLLQYLLDGHAFLNLDCEQVQSPNNSSNLYFLINLHITLI